VAQADAPTDAQLITQILAGSQARYRLLVERHQQAVYNAAYRLLGNRDEAADITQDAFLRAYRALDTFQQDKSLAPWLCRIAINLALNRLKRQRPTLSLDDERQNPGLDLPDASAEPQAGLLRSERQQALRQAILDLPPEQRVVIELRHFQEQSYEEIAAGLNISLANVKSRLFRARQKLRQMLEQIL
jgi:RNA polymerase sigma-70 factor (ECF subfamily)